MVKLFVGGLPEGVDSIRLRQLFSQFVIVNECDVIKDYAFVHVADEEAARIAIEKLDGYILEGKAINIRRSTSKLRKEPGMDRRCFRCGAADHKTPQCPNDSSNALKRVGSSNSALTTLTGGPDVKRFASDPLTSTASYTPTIKIDLTGRAVETAVNAVSAAPAVVAMTAAPAYAYTQMQPQPVMQPAPVLTTVMPAPAETDHELPRPVDSDLLPLYEQYIDSRTKYFYFRDRLSKEVKIRSQLMPAASVAPLQAPYTTTLYAAQPQQQTQYAQQVIPTGTPYASTQQQFYTPAAAVPNSNLTTVYAPAAAVQQQPARLY